MQKKKILIFARGGVGGAERMSVTFGKMFDKNKFEIIFTLWTPDEKNVPMKAFIPQGYETRIITKVPLLGYLWHLYTEIRDVKPDIVFCSLMFMNIRIMALSILFPHMKFVMRDDNYLYTYPKYKVNLLRLVYKKVHRIIVQTQEMKDELVQVAKIPLDKVVIISNPLDLSTIDSKSAEPSPFMDDGKIKFVASGRFVPEKGFDILVNAYSIVQKQISNSELFILGKIDEECEEHYNYVRSLIAAKGIYSSVHCLGFQTNPYIYVKSADCFVLSSRNEGLPNVLIESQYLGTPSAATKCIPVIVRIVREGVNGYLAEPENPESLAKAMINACRLGRVKQTYIPSTSSEVISAFLD